MTDRTARQAAFAGAEPVGPAPDSPRYSICVLVSDANEYTAARESFHAGGFVSPDSEFLYLDNTCGNAHDAYQACNLFLRAARGRYVILCHQDIRLLADGRDRLDAVIAELDRLDPSWGLFGNAGGLADGTLALRITQPDGRDLSVGGPFPVRCRSLDENFVVVRAEANLAVSSDLQGFHLYGTDMCIVADLLGRSAYVVDFHLEHRSQGDDGPAFVQARRAMINKYGRALVPRLIATTCTTLMIVPFAPLAFLANTGKGIILARALRRFLLAATWRRRG